MKEHKIKARAIEMISMVGLSGFAERLPNRLSGGQRRRVALARACVTEPPVLICDDPTAGLDPVTSRKILDMIAGIRYQTNSTVIVVSSDVNGLLSISARVAVVWNGKVIEEETPAALAESNRAEVMRFLDDARLPLEGGLWQQEA
jgi:phospholipid/cholesterol/gamma-HCH transport system ATP-binding protein